ncbi:hypothetical protein FA13DRAFT_1716209 [Coprinellus micaceus]|uniref:Uncharacterized protein n=1 Tax=Coprinellus micaceus TaxID=71717 RepID=A0A4Y7SKE2_COPMI|nr:hypothetical protein FA13DRAFT_1716209 [Coprinellus micaceus]
MPSTSLNLPSQGFWYLTVETARKTLIRPGATMLLDLVVRVTPSEIEGNATSIAQKSGLVLESGLVPTPNDAPQRGTIAILGHVDSALTHIRLYQGQTYIFEIVGGDVSMYIAGRFDTPNDTLAEDTAVLQITIVFHKDHTSSTVVRLRQEVGGGSVPSEREEEAALATHGVNGSTPCKGIREVWGRRTEIRHGVDIRCSVSPLDGFGTAWWYCRGGKRGLGKRLLGMSVRSRLSAADLGNTVEEETEDKGAPSERINQTPSR